MEPDQVASQSCCLIEFSPILRDRDAGAGALKFRPEKTGVRLPSQHGIDIGRKVFRRWHRPMGLSDPFEQAIRDVRVGSIGVTVQRKDAVVPPLAETMKIGKFGRGDKGCPVTQGIPDHCREAQHFVSAQA